MAQIEIIVGSVYGNAQNVAEHAEQFLISAGHQVNVHTDPDIDLLKEDAAFLVITSTTGMGDVPPNLELFFADVQADLPSLQGKKYAIAALGDSSYCESYCGAGKQFAELFAQLQGEEITPMLELDSMETFTPEEDVVAWLKQHNIQFSA
jgi:flavodoxin